MTPINLHGAVLDSEGKVQNKTEIINDDLRVQPDVAFNGNNYFVVYGQPGKIKALCYDTNGELFYPYDILLDEFYPYGQSYFPKIQFGLSNHLVIFVTDYSRKSDLIGMIVYSNGSLGNGFVWGDVWQYHYAYSVSFDGENFLVLYNSYGIKNNQNGLDGAIVDTSGKVIDDVDILTSGETDDASVCFDGTNYLVVIQINYTNNWDIYGTRITPSGEVLDTLGFPISTADSNQVNPEVVFDGENFIVVWEDYRNGNESDIYGATIDTDGNVLESFEVSTQDGDQLNPALCKGSGNRVMVVYSGWTGEYQGKTYNSMRIWGKMLDMLNEVNEDKNDFIVTDFKLEQNFPNPFNPSTKIIHSVPQASNVIIKLFNVLDNEIETLIKEEKPAGVLN